MKTYVVIRKKIDALILVSIFLILPVSLVHGINASRDRDSLRGILQKTTGPEHVRTLNLLCEKIRIDSPEVAFQYAMKSVVLARKGHYSDEEAVAWKNLALVSIMKGRLGQADDYLEVSLRIASHSGKPSTLATIYKTSGRVKMRQKHFREALGKYLEAEKARTGAGLPPDPDLFERMGECYKYLNDNTRAVTYYRLAADLFSKHDPNGRLPFVLGYLAIIYNEWGWNELALDCFGKALVLQLGSGDSIAAAFTYCNMADVYSRTLGHRKAIECTEKGLDIFKKKNDHGGMGYAMNGLGTSYYILGEYQTALECFKQSLAWHKKAGAPEQMSFTLANIAEILIKEGKYHDAISNLNGAILYADSAKSDLARSAAMTSLGKFYQMTGNASKSAGFFLKSQEIASQRGFKQLMADNFLALAVSSEKIGNFRQAYRYLKEHGALHDTIASEASRKVVAEMEARFALQAKNELIGRLTRENELKRETIRSKNSFTLLIIFSSLTILLLSLLLTRFYYLKVKAYQRTVQLTVARMRMQAPDISPQERVTNGNQMEAGYEQEGHYPYHVASGMELINRLMKLVEDERLFLNPELSLTEVAARLNTNTTYLSRAVNDILKKNFPAYINEKRICEAQKMLADPDYANRSIEGIARMAGFKSKSAFNEAFKRFTGMTPSFFQRSALKL